MITKGEWGVALGLYPFTVSASAKGREVEIAAIHRQPDDTDEANAKLISASPDLYEALKDILNRFNVPMDYKLDSNWDRALKALSKAE